MNFQEGDATWKEGEREKERTEERDSSGGKERERKVMEDERPADYMERKKGEDREESTGDGRR